LDDESISSSLAVADEMAYIEYSVADHREITPKGCEDLSGIKSEHQMCDHCSYGGRQDDDVSSLGNLDHIDLAPPAIHNGTVPEQRPVDAVIHPDIVCIIPTENTKINGEELGGMDDFGSTFAAGDELVQLRRNILKMQWKLQKAILFKFQNSISILTAAILDATSRDPSIVYVRSQKEYSQAIEEGEMGRAADIIGTMMNSRRCIRHLNLHGLWICKNSERYNIVDITYAGGHMGDYLIARKITGKDNTPQKKNTVNNSIILQVPMNPNQDSVDAVASGLNSEGLQRKASLSSAADVFFGKSRIFSKAWTEGIFSLHSEDQFTFSYMNSKRKFIFTRRPVAERILLLIREHVPRRDVDS